MLRKCGIWIIGTIVLLIPLLVYIINFSDSPISKNPADWSAFGDYIGGIYSVLMTIAIVFLTNRIAKQEKKYEKRADAAAELMNNLQGIIHSREKNRQKRIAKINDFFLLNERNAFYLSKRVHDEMKSVFDILILDEDPAQAKDPEKQNKLNRALKILKKVYDGEIY